MSGESNKNHRRGCARRALAAFAVSLAAATGVAAVAVATAAPAAAESNGLALTPPMGFNDWNAFKCNTSEALIEQTADAMVANGMQAAGYQYVNIDDCWLLSARDAAGNLVADPAKFPSGIKALAAYVHRDGLKLGIYEDAGTSTCAGYPGSLGHEQQDATLFASWDIDYLKYDQCNIPFANYPGLTHQQIDTQLYTTMSQALRATGRPIVFSMCNGTDAAALPWLWGAPVSNLWRTTTDIQDRFGSMTSLVAQNAQLAQYAKPGAWNDPDMLEIGNGGMTTAEYQSEFSLWSVMAAPLIAGTDLRSVSPANLAIYTNRDVIAVDQDRLGKQGVLLSSADGHDVFAKPLAGGDVAVALFNASSTAATIATTAPAAGLARSTVYVEKDLWSKTSTETAKTISAFVPAHATVMYRMSVAKNPRRAMTNAPNTTLDVSSSSTELHPGTSTTVTVSLTDNGRAALTRPALGLQVPAGWIAYEVRAAKRSAVTTGKSATAKFRVVAPSTAAPISTGDLVATAHYRSTTGAQTVQSTLSQLLVSPVAAPNRTANTTGTAAVFGQSGTSFAIDAAGAGVGAATSRSAATDQYGAIYRAGAAGVTASAQTTVVATGTGRGSKAGLMMRNDATASGSPEGVVLYVTGTGTVSMSWNASGGATVDTSSPATTPQSLPVQLRLVRNGASYSGFYSSDGATWTLVATAVVAAAASTARQDVALFETSGSTTPMQTNFSGFVVS